MRIISKFRDYYDSAQGMGIDDKLTFVRKQEVIKDVDLSDKILSLFKALPRCLRFSCSGSSYRVERSLIGFCGYLYPVFTLSDYHNTYYSYSPETFKYKDKIAYGLEDTVTFLSLKERRDALKSFNKSRSARELSISYGRRVAFIRQNLERMNWKIEHTDLFQQYKRPIFLLRKGKGEWDGREWAGGFELTLNPCLQELEFYRRMDTYTAYQEIAMYLGGVLGVGEPDTLGISDVDMRNAKGFDKWSFKTMPTKHKKRGK